MEFFFSDFLTKQVLLGRLLILVERGPVLVHPFNLREGALRDDTFFDLKSFQVFNLLLLLEDLLALRTLLLLELLSMFSFPDRTNIVHVRGIPIFLRQVR